MEANKRAGRAIAVASAVTAALVAVGGCGPRETAQEVYLRESSTLKELKAEHLAASDYMAMLESHRDIARAGRRTGDVAKIEASLKKAKSRIEETWAAVEKQRSRVDAARAALVGDDGR